MPSKMFFPETGYMVRKGSFWHDHRVLLTVEPGQRIDIVRRGYAGKPALRLGSFDYEQLDPKAPPTGLREVDTVDGRPNPFVVLVGKTA
ncbi:MAG: hypothetical protein KIT36_19880 [Alphaproteobacteria bacterium]|nr:hypothetical protein [Alphaproteobacteria bacterium]